MTIPLYNIDVPEPANDPGRYGVMINIGFHPRSIAKISIPDPYLKGFVIYSSGLFDECVTDQNWSNISPLGLCAYYIAHAKATTLGIDEPDKKLTYAMVDMCGSYSPPELLLPMEQAQLHVIQLVKNLNGNPNALTEITTMNQAEFARMFTNPKVYPNRVGLGDRWPVADAFVHS